MFISSLIKEAPREVIQKRGTFQCQGSTFLFSYRPVAPMLWDQMAAPGGPVREGEELAITGRATPLFKDLSRSPHNTSIEILVTWSLLAAVVDRKCNLYMGWFVTSQKSRMI